MKKISIIILSFVVILVIIVIICHQPNNHLVIKEDQIQIDKRNITVTPDIDQGVNNNNYGIKKYENRDSVDIKITDKHIVTYYGVKIGDNKNKLSFCEKHIGIVYYFESKYKHQGYNLEIQYGIGYDDCIIGITYHFYK